jgi:fatty-acyl-CoA synthase
MSFTPETLESIARAREHSVGDLLRRTALRYLGKLAILVALR